MSPLTVESIIRKAVADGEFCAALINHPTETLAGYDLSDEERAKLSSLDGTLFNCIPADLEPRISRVASGGGWDAN